MTTTASATIPTDLGLINKGWLEKLQFDLEDDSTKVEVNDISATSLQLDSRKADTSLLSDAISTASGTTSDSYLQSILSSSGPVKKATTESCTGESDCNCYKCQRQRRRAVTFRSTAPKSLVNNPYTPLDKLSNSTGTEHTPDQLEDFATATDAKAEHSKRSADEKSQSTSLKRQHTVLNTTSDLPIKAEQKKPVARAVSADRSSTLRKTPTIKSYEKHLPPPEYSEDDCIYRAEALRKQLEDEQAADELSRTNTTHATLGSSEGGRKRRDYQHFRQQQRHENDDYKISWREDETGDDLLTPLVTFQTIFEEKANTNEGLSDLLEQRAKELKYQKLKEKEEEAKQSEIGTELPPRLPDCLTLTYREGPKHKSLTLFHTMKMKSEKDRIRAYDTAFHHCVHADSNMRHWLKRKREAPKQENSKLIQTVRKPTVKKGLFNTLSSRKNRIAGDNMRQHTGSSSLTRDDYMNYPYPVPIANHTGSKRSLSENENKRQDIRQQTPDRSNHYHTATQQSFKDAPVDVALQQTTGSFEYNEAWSRLVQTNIPIAISNSDKHEGKDNSSIISSESSNSKKTQANVLKAKSSRLFSSIGRKASIKPPKSNTSQKAPSIHSFDRTDSGIRFFSIRKAATKQ